MGVDAWAHAFSYTLANEGSTYVTDPSPTFRGVTLATLTAFRGKSCTVADLKAMSLSETQQLYKSLYWDRVQGDLINSEALATVVYDTAVNSGVGTAIKLLQQTLGVVVDGVLGPKTLAALNCRDPKIFMFAYVPLRLQQYVSYVEAQPERRLYLKTWLRRAAAYLELVA